MSKRGPDKTPAHKTRKRKWKGVSVSSSPLKLPDAPPRGTQPMRIWHTNVEDPSTSRKSAVAVLSKTQAREAIAEDGGGELKSNTPVFGAVPARAKQKQRNDSTKTEVWLSFRPMILDELIRHDGLQEHASPSPCANCLEQLGTYKCIDCTAQVLYCAPCIVHQHESLPLHRLEVWDGGFFRRTSLKDLDHCFYIGHQHTSCPSSGSDTQVIVVIDVNGAHHVNVQFCTCIGTKESVESYRQLLRLGWYPASFKRPKMAFTFNVLDTYHKLSIQGKLNLYDFYSALLQKTDNSGQKRVIYRYHEMSRCVRQWKHLKQVKRGGGGHIMAGLASIPDGAFALECPACPHPGRNLPQDWDQTPEDKQWLYSSFLAVDANFRLKLKSRGISDPEIGSGWSYFVENNQYSQHITQKTAEAEVVGCNSAFHAVNQANNRPSKDYITSGVVACVCARHTLMQKNGVSDLQRGERYINTDYIIASILKGLTVRNVVISYDIACKWSIHHLQRISDNHPDLDVDNLQLSYLIPKFHLPGHDASCQTEYSFNYAKGVGRTHGETVEQSWANMNLAAVSTREMGPGARHLFLDDNWSGWNWKKILGMGDFILRSLLKALLMKRKHTSENSKFDAMFPVDLREKWMSMIQNWERDKSKPNPYTHKEKADSLAEVRRKLAEADEEDAGQGTTSHQVPGSVFIRTGLEIEEQQRQLASAIKKKSPRSDTQIASIQEKRNALMWKIGKWRELQLIYMPGAIVNPLQISEDDAEDNIEMAENVSLFLPSNVDPGRRESVCPQQVAEHERLLRMAQLQDSLVELRHTRKVRRRLSVNHRTQIAGQGQRANTRSRAVINNIENRITKFVERYRATYHALLQLDPTGNWQETFLELKDSDNRGPGKEVDEEGVGDGSYFRSWIWSSNPQVSNLANDEAGEECASEEDVNEILRVEWTTSFARLERWAEEAELLQEEARRVVAFLEWQSRDWLAKVDARREGLVSDIQSGLGAYARKQAAIYHNLAISFLKLWHPTLISYDLQRSWVTEYMVEHGVSLTDTNIPAPRARGIFKFRVSNESDNSTSVSSDLPVTEEATGGCRLPEEDDDSEESGSEGSDSDLDLDDWDEDLDF